MKRSYRHALGILPILIMALVLVACGSSDEDIPEPQANQTNSQATADAPEVSGAAIQPTTAVVAPTASTSQSASTGDWPDAGSGEGHEASLGEMIVGSWLDTSPDVSDMLDFLPDGRFFMDSGVDSALAGDITYEVVGEDTIVITDHRYAQDNTFPIVVGEINEDSMTLLQNPWSGGQVTFKKLRGADNLPVDILGLWSLEPVEPPPADGTQPDIWFGVMIFNPDGTVLGGATGTTYQILSNSAIALQNPAWDQSAAIRVDNISGDTGAFQFEIWDPPVQYKRHYEDDRLKAKLIGLWSDGAVEFTADGRRIHSAYGEVYSYRIYDDGTLLTLSDDEVTVNQVRFKSDDEFYLCYLGQMEGGSLLWECGEEDSVVTRTKAP